VGRIVTPKWKLELRVAGPFVISPFVWRREYGRPTAANLARFVAKFEEGTKPGGPNEHLGVTKVLAAEIKRNVAGGETIARFAA
jgi:hypothetical protein